MAISTPVEIERQASWGDWLKFTPSWTSSGTNPAIGNGAIRGRYRRRGSEGQVRWHVKIGTTTTFGTAEWRLSLPDGWTVSASDGQTDWYQSCGGLVVPDAVSAFDIAAWAQPGQTYVRLIYPSAYDTTAGERTASQSMGPAMPVTWTASTVNFIAVGTMTLELEDPL